MKKGKLIYDERAGGWRRLPAEAAGIDLLIASGLLFVIATVIAIVCWNVL